MILCGSSSLCQGQLQSFSLCLHPVTAHRHKACNTSNLSSSSHQLVLVMRVEVSHVSETRMTRNDQVSLSALLSEAAVFLVARDQKGQFQEITGSLSAVTSVGSRGPTEETSPAVHHLLPLGGLGGEGGGAQVGHQLAVELLFVPTRRYHEDSRSGGGYAAKSLSAGGCQAPPLPFPPSSHPRSDGSHTVWDLCPMCCDGSCGSRGPVFGTSGKGY